MNLSNKLAEKIHKIVENSYELPNCRYKHFSFIVERNKIVSFGWNSSFKTHPLAAKYGHRFSSIHSELHAIKNFPYPIKCLAVDYDFINVRINKRHNYCISKPCLHCVQLLVAFGVKKICFSTGINFEFEELSLI